MPKGIPKNGINKGRFKKGHIPKVHFKKGHIPWNKGLKGDKRLRGAPKGHPYWGDERKGRTYVEIYGKKRTDEIMKKGNDSWFKKGHVSKVHFKKGNIPWNKGLGKQIKSQRQKENNYRKHIEWRTAVFKRDKYICQECGQVGGKLNAHHIKPWHLYPKLRYIISNGQTLCTGCHQIKTAKHLKTYWKNQFAKATIEK